MGNDYSQALVSAEVLGYTSHMGMVEIPRWTQWGLGGVQVQGGRFAFFLQGIIWGDHKAREACVLRATLAVRAWSCVATDQEG